RPRADDGRHPTGLRALTQSGEYFEAGITVGGLHADLFMIDEDGSDCVPAGTPIDAIGLEAVFVETALNLLDFVQGRHALPSGELLAEGQITADPVAKVAERQCVTRGRIVGIDRTKILADQECWPVGDRQPELHLIARPRESRAIGAPHTEFLPFSIGPHGAIVSEPPAARRQGDL